MRAATAADIAEAYGVPERLDLLTVDGEIAAFGSLMRRSSGRLIANFEIVDANLARKHSLRAMLALRRTLLATRERPIYSWCWEERYETARRLLTVLGFRPTDEFHHNGSRVWILLE